MENALLERVRTQFDNLKTLSDELQVQMALGKAEARDLMESERKILSQYIRKQRRELDNLEHGSYDNRVKFISTVEELESSLISPVPENHEDYDAYKNKVLHKIFEIEELSKELSLNLGSEIHRNLDTFKVKMDAFRVNLALHDKDNPEKVTRVRNEFTERLSSIRTLLSEHESDQSKINNFVEDISQSFKFLKRAISDLSN